jgi:PAS domain S-box-containing protein
VESLIQVTSEQISTEQRFQLLIDGVSDYAIYMLAPEGHVSSWNSGAQQFKGYRPSEIIGQHFSRFYTPKEQAQANLIRLSKLR